MTALHNLARQRRQVHAARRVRRVRGCAQSAAGTGVGGRRTGPGISAADTERVFQRFYRAPGTAGRPGSGLGLAIVLAAAKASGGSVRVAPADAGTRMEIRLPLSPLSA